MVVRFTKRLAFWQERFLRRWGGEGAVTNIQRDRCGGVKGSALLHRRGQ
jgi:hypothetical protein